MKIPFGSSRSRRGVVFVFVLSRQIHCKFSFLSYKNDKTQSIFGDQGGSKEYNKNARFRAIKAVLIKYFLYNDVRKHDSRLYV